MTAATRRPEPSPWLRELARLLVMAQRQGHEKAAPANETPEAAQEVRRARVETST